MNAPCLVETLHLESCATLHCTTAAGHHFLKAYGARVSLFCSTRGLHLVAHALHFAELAHQISAKNLLDVVRAVAAVKQRLRDLRQIGGRVDPLRRGATHAVEI